MPCLLRSLLAACALFAGTAHAATITVTSTSGASNVVSACVLRDAIAAAENNAPRGACAAGNGADTIVLPPAALITLTDLDNATLSGNGLPVIASTLIIEGNGATIERASGLTCTLDGVAAATEFRLFAVLASGNLTLRRLTLRNGCPDGSTDSGGAIYNQGILTLAHVRLSLNRARSFAGAVFTYGDLNADYCVFSNNSASEGGAIANSYDPRSIVIDHSLLVGNSATGAVDGGLGLGGGIYHYVGSVTVRNTTIAQNTAGYGGAIWLRVDPMTLSNVTIANNSATQGAGGISDFALGGANVLRVKNVLLASNSGGNCGLQAGQLQALGSNLSSDASCAGFTLSGIDPLLGALAANGGESDTLALLANSPALNAANNCLDAAGTVTLNTDQRGRLRPFGGACDLGAFEFDDSIFIDGFSFTY